MKLFKTKENLANVPDYKLLKVAEIKFAPYQRALKQSKVKKYASNFDYDVFGVPLVSYRDGEYWCVDGQHRIEALKLNSVTTVLCQVLHELTYSEEADKFVKLNSERGALSANQKFHGKYESGDPIAVKVVGVLNSNGLNYSKDTGTRQDNRIGCMSCVEKIAAKKGVNHLARVISIIKQAWYGTSDSLSRDIISGISTFITENPRTKDEILIKALERVTPSGIELQSRVYGAANGICMSSGSTKCYHVAKIIRDLYMDEAKKVKKNNSGRGGRVV